MMILKVSIFIQTIINNKMKESEIFTTITLLNGEKCDIKDVRFKHISKANYKLTTQQNTQYDFIFFFLQEILIINGETPKVGFIEDLMIDDYIKINDVINVIMQKLPKV